MPSPQVGWQGPQSAAQVAHVSPPLHTRSPHWGRQGPQSPGHVLHVSVPLQRPSPQAGGQTPQSPGQVWHVSLPLQAWSPQVAGHAPQSPGQVAHDSSPLHVPSPQLPGQGPQSVEQVQLVSVPLQAPSPHRGGQSPGQVFEFSVESQTPLPQLLHAPQSPGQVAQVSLPAVQIWSPQATGGHPEQSTVHFEQSTDATKAEANDAEDTAFALSLVGAELQAPSTKSASASTRRKFTTTQQSGFIEQRKCTGRTDRGRSKELIRGVMFSSTRAGQDQREIKSIRGGFKDAASWLISRHFGCYTSTARGASEKILWPMGISEMPIGRRSPLVANQIVQSSIWAKATPLEPENGWNRLGGRRQHRVFWGELSPGHVFRMGEAAYAPTLLDREEARDADQFSSRRHPPPAVSLNGFMAAEARLRLASDKQGRPRFCSCPFHIAILPRRRMAPRVTRDTDWVLWGAKRRARNRGRLDSALLRLIGGVFS